MIGIRRTSFGVYRFFSNNACSGTCTPTFNICEKEKDKNVNNINNMNMRFSIMDTIMDRSIHQTNMNLAMMDTLIQQTNEIKYMKYELMKLHEKINRIANSERDLPVKKD